MDLDEKLDKNGKRKKLGIPNSGCTRSTGIYVVVDSVHCRIPALELPIRLSVILHVLGRQGYLSRSIDNTAFCNSCLSDRILFRSMFGQPTSFVVDRVHCRQRFSELVSFRI